MSGIWEYLDTLDMNFLHSQIKNITKVGNHFKIVTDENEITAQYIVIATGQRVKEFEAIEAIPGSEYLIASQRVCFNPGALTVEKWFLL
ncbi:NAD(P)-binding domain-containing protein [Anabaenopsis sp. FSS-46]|uniref:hypothetical protein n=1 Tax=Anabaenopsis sp. FSS-46 TaxID=2971766 RepID=UPI00247519BC|nr:hypothetical protein [Anabaenopsis sp. FSS-46]MDH6100806.1 NAD(P)-binding domain-containing protein [Anabaenopsis sp. FSS-46]